MAMAIWVIAMAMVVWRMAIGMGEPDGDRDGDGSWEATEDGAIAT